MRVELIEYVQKVPVADEWSPVSNRNTPSAPGDGKDGFLHNRNATRKFEHVLVLSSRWDVELARVSATQFQPDSEFLRQLDAISLADRLRDHIWRCQRHGDEPAYDDLQDLIRHAGKLPDELYKSMTWYRGKEIADRKRFTVATDIKALESGH
jgi:IS30 family transposase